MANSPRHSLFAGSSVFVGEALLPIYFSNDLLMIFQNH